jgi:hypothetical protein
MPQLDTVTFLSQFFWLFVLYTSFYIVLAKVFLPRMAAILKVREAGSAEGALNEAQGSAESWTAFQLSKVPSALGVHALNTSISSHHASLAQYLQDQSSAQTIQKPYMDAVSNLYTSQQIHTSADLKVALFPQASEKKNIKDLRTKMFLALLSQSLAGKK